MHACACPHADRWFSPSQRLRENPFFHLANLPTGSPQRVCLRHDRLGRRVGKLFSFRNISFLSELSGIAWELLHFYLLFINPWPRPQGTRPPRRRLHQACPRQACSWPGAGWSLKPAINIKSWNPFHNYGNNSMEYFPRHNRLEYLSCYLNASYDYYIFRHPVRYV